MSCQNQSFHCFCAKPRGHDGTFITSCPQLFMQKTKNIGFCMTFWGHTIQKKIVLIKWIKKKSFNFLAAFYFLKHRKHFSTHKTQIFKGFIASNAETIQFKKKYKKNTQKSKKHKKNGTKTTWHMLLLALTPCCITMCHYVLCLRLECCVYSTVLAMPYDANAMTPWLWLWSSNQFANPPQMSLITQHSEPICSQSFQCQKTYSISMF